MRYWESWSFRLPVTQEITGSNPVYRAKQRKEPQMPASSVENESLPTVLLLDFDGPLWSDRVIKFHPENKDKHPKMEHLRNKMIEFGDTFVAATLTYWKMDEVAVGMLNHLMEVKPFKTVISSSWRELCSKETIQYILFMNNLKLDLHHDWLTDIRPAGFSYGSKAYSDRLSDVHRWIVQHKDEISDYVILDDPSSGGSLTDDKLVKQVGLDPSRVVIVNEEVGMEIDHFLTIKEILDR